MIVVFISLIKEKTYHLTKMTLLQFSDVQSPESTGTSDYITAVIVGLAVLYLTALNIYYIYSYVNRRDPSRNELNKKHPKALVLSSIAGCIWISVLIVTHDHFEALEKIKNEACIVWTLYLEQFVGLSVLLTVNNMRLFYYYKTYGYGGFNYTTEGWRCIFKGNEIGFALGLLSPMFLLCIFATLLNGVRYEPEIEQCISTPIVRVLVIMYIIVQFLFFGVLTWVNHQVVPRNVISEKRMTIFYIVLVCIMGALIIPIKLTSEIYERDGRVIATLSSVLVVVSFHTSMTGRILFSKLRSLCGKNINKDRIEYRLLGSNNPAGGGRARKIIHDDMLFAYIIMKAFNVKSELKLSDLEEYEKSSSIIPFHKNELDAWDKIHDNANLVMHFLRFLYEGDIEIKRKRSQYTPPGKDEENSRSISAEESESSSEEKSKGRTLKELLKDGDVSSEDEEEKPREILNVGSVREVEEESNLNEFPGVKERVENHMMKLLGNEEISSEFRTNIPMIQTLLKDGPRDFFYSLNMFDDDVVNNHSHNIVSLYVEVTFMIVQINQLLEDVATKEKELVIKTGSNEFSSDYMVRVKMDLYSKYFNNFMRDYESCMIVYVLRPEDLRDMFNIQDSKLRINFDKKTFNAILLIYKAFVELIDMGNTDYYPCLVDLIYYSAYFLRKWCEDKFRRFFYPMYISEDEKNGLAQFLAEGRLKARAEALLRLEDLTSLQNNNEESMVRLNSRYDIRSNDVGNGENKTQEKKKVTFEIGENVEMEEFEIKDN